LTEAFAVSWLVFEADLRRTWLAKACLPDPQKEQQDD
jgi:hypothetical protein